MEDVEKNQKNDLFIPVNCPHIPYIINGYTATDLSIIAFIGGIALILAMYFYLARHMLVWPFIVFLFTVIVAIGYFHRNQNGENTTDHIKIAIAYHKMEKHYIYIYKDPNRVEIVEMINQKKKWKN